jgi:hypothetical protein
MSLVLSIYGVIVAFIFSFIFNTKLAKRLSRDRDADLKDDE